MSRMRIFMVMLWRDDATLAETFSVCGKLFHKVKAFCVRVYSCVCDDGIESC